MDQYTAKHRFADVSPRKMRPFAQLIRNKNVDDALEQLRFYPNRGARLIEAVLRSAIANAQHQGERDLDALIVTEARIDGAPMFKRIRPRARGTAFMIQRRLAHIVISVGPEPADSAPLDIQTEAVDMALTTSASVPALPTALSVPDTSAETTPAVQPASESSVVSTEPTASLVDESAASDAPQTSETESSAAKPDEAKPGTA